jgi:hypothetical protein
MKLRNRNIAQKIIAFGSLALVALILCNNAIYLHSHKLANGEIVVHAHPFNKSNKSSQSGESHKHTKAEFLFLENLYLLFSISILAFSFLKLEKKKPRIRFNSDSHFKTIYSILNDRAPPAFTS